MSNRAQTNCKNALITLSGFYQNFELVGLKKPGLRWQNFVNRTYFLTSFLQASESQSNQPLCPKKFCSDQFDVFVLVFVVTRGRRRRRRRGFDALLSGGRGRNRSDEACPSPSPVLATAASADASADADGGPEIRFHGRMIKYDTHLSDAYQKF